MPGKTAAVLDPYTSTAQWSRRFIGLKLFLALAERGESGYAGDDRTPGSNGRRAAAIAREYRAGVS